ncbi:hypothetical protein FQA39_LY18701 [Lamprigera yunnana]|nr:hypothetical protein FQA39_LY18701 [Lamprigera yunnana]
MYADKYPHRTHQSFNVFWRLAARVCTTGQVQPTYNRGNRIRRHVRNDKEPDILATESMNSGGRNKELAKSQVTSKTSSTQKLLLETELKAEIELNEIMERKQEIQRINLELKKKMI